jgi:hypothetical protein
MRIRIRVHIEVKSRIQIRIRIKCWIGIRIKVMRIRSPSFFNAGKIEEVKQLYQLIGLIHCYVAGAAVPGPSLLQGWQDEGGKGHPSQGPPSSTTGSTMERVTISDFLLWGFAVRYYPDPDPQAYVLP